MRDITDKKKEGSQMGFVLLEAYPFTPNHNLQTLWPRSYTHLRSVAP